MYIAHKTLLVTLRYPINYLYLDMEFFQSEAFLKRYTFTLESTQRTHKNRTISL